jgi:uncharacterized protein (TIGR00725 family)
MSVAYRRPIVGVMGSGIEPHAELATPLGELLARLGVHLLTGGGAGVMAEVSKAFTASTPRAGLSIGILPSEEGDPLCRPKAGYPNPWIELPIMTHLPLIGERGAEPMSRNHSNILSTDAIIILPGGAGTMSEARLAVRYDRPALAYFGAAERGDLPSEIPMASDITEIERFLKNVLKQ